MNFNNSDYEKYCENCGQPFIAERKTRRYCSDSCRQLVYLKRKAQKLANLSEENKLPPTHISESPDLIPEEPKEDLKQFDSSATNPLITENDNEINKKTRRRPKRIRQRNLTRNDNSILLDGRVVLFGVAVTGLFIYNYYNKPKALNKTNHPGAQQTEPDSSPTSYLTIPDNRNKSEKAAFQTNIASNESQKLEKS